MTIINQKCFSSLALILLGTMIFAGCGQGNSNYKAPGTGTYDKANDLRAPENETKLVETLVTMSMNPIPLKAKMACDKLGRMGAVAESAIPGLQKTAEEHANQQVKDSAQAAIEAIQKDMAKAAGE